ncbi:MAG: hypothetical protein WCF36_14140 [Candidatus Nanopelagicales bacterium]
MAIARVAGVAGVAGVGIGSGGMGANQHGLFDLPDRARPGTADREPRGRNRQTWARTATAEVTVIDAGALLEAAAHAAENAVTIELPAHPGVEGTEPGSCDVALASDAFDALGWLICPTAGMEGPLEAGALRVVCVDSEVVAESVDRGTVTWTVTVKLTDVDGLRGFAVEAQPDAAGLIAASLAVAWQHAADPFAPLRSIPGVAWRSGQVDVEHRPARVVGDR